MKKSYLPLLGLSVLALLQVMCATITIENTSGEEAAVTLTVASGGPYSAQVPPGGSVYWTVSRSGPYTVSVFPFEPYRNLMLEKRGIIQTLLKDKTLSPTKRSELLRQVTPDQLQLGIDDLKLWGGATSCTGTIPEISDYVEDDFANIFVKVSYDTNSVQWNAECG